MRFVGWVDFLQGWMDFLDGWMDGCFDGWMDVLMDGWMDVFFVETAQGIWYDQHGNPQAAAAQVSGIGEGLSGYVPSTEPLPASYVASERYKENERLKKELNERIKRDREEKNHKRFEELKKKVEARRQAEAEAKASSSKASSSSSAAPMGEPQVKAMPNPYMSVEYCQQNSSVTIEEVEMSYEIAIPHPKRHQQYKAYDAAMKRQKKE